MENLDLGARIVEALLIASDIPLTQQRLNDSVEEGLEIDLQACVEHLNIIYRDTRRSFFIDQIGGGYIIMTHRDFEQNIRRFINRSGRIRLSSAALETLAIIAYRQPVSRSDIESIRGVNSDAVLATLLERNLIVVKGRADQPGRPLLYGSSDDFLKYFGLNSPADLPRLKELEKLTGELSAAGSAMERPFSDESAAGNISETESVSEILNETDEPRGEMTDHETE